MTSDLSNFAARLREYILSEGRALRVSEVHSKEEIGDSRRSSLRDETIFNSLALELFALQFDANPAYRRICAARNYSPANVAHWAEIPAVPAAAFKEVELSCLPPEQRTAVFHSSGTTLQKPSRHFHSAESLAVYETSALSFFNARFGRAGQLLILTPPPAQAPNSSLVHMFEAIRRDRAMPESVFVGKAASDGSWTLDFDAMLAALNSPLATRHAPLILGTAFSFVHLLDHLAEKNLRFRLPENSRVMETGGYKGRSRVLPKTELHALITERLGVSSTHIACEYGMSELSSQAYETVTGDECRVTGKAALSRHPSRVTGHFFFPPWSRVQIVSPETGCEVSDGETGLLRVFDLANVFSVMAIQTEDLAIRRGHGFELIGRATQAEPRGCSLMSSEFRVPSSEFK